MPISPIKIQRRMSELGRVRAGAKQGGNGRPVKLATFRFTSPTERYITDIAALYGGEPRPWDNGGKPEFEVFTEANSIPVIAVKGGLSQWMETWSGGGCVHRCDGERDVEGNLCDPDDPKHVAAKPTTRLSVMLPELEAIGMWRLESHGWNAAAEIPAVAELAQFVGDLVPATLNLVERRSVKDGQTSRFVVPVLDLQIGTARLRELVAQKAGLELEAGPSTPASVAAAIEAPAQPEAAVPETAPGQVTIPTSQQIAEADLATVGRMVVYLQQHVPDHPATKAAEARAAELVKAAVPDEDGAVEAEWTETPAASAAGGEPDPNTVWRDILARAGEIGWTEGRLRQDFADSMGMEPIEASGAELASYLHQMTTGEAVAS